MQFRTRAILWTGGLSATALIVFSPGNTSATSATYPEIESVSIGRSTRGVDYSLELTRADDGTQIIQGMATVPEGPQRTNRAERTLHDALTGEERSPRNTTWDKTIRADDLDGPAAFVMTYEYEYGNGRTCTDRSKAFFLIPEGQNVRVQLADELGRGVSTISSDWFHSWTIVNNEAPGPCDNGIELG